MRFLVCLLTFSLIAGCSFFQNTSKSTSPTVPRKYYSEPAKKYTPKTVVQTDVDLDKKLKLISDGLLNFVKTKKAKSPHFNNVRVHVYVDPIKNELNANFDLIPAKNDTFYFRPGFYYLTDEDKNDIQEFAKLLLFINEVLGYLEKHSVNLSKSEFKGIFYGGADSLQFKRTPYYEGEFGPIKESNVIIDGKPMVIQLEVNDSFDPLNKGFGHKNGVLAFLRSYYVYSALMDNFSKYSIKRKNFSTVSFVADSRGKAIPTSRYARISIYINKDMLSHYSG